MGDAGRLVIRTYAHKAGNKQNVQRDQLDLGLSPDYVHGGGAGLEEVGGVLDGRDVAEDALPDVLWSKNFFVTFITYL